LLKVSNSKIKTWRRCPNSYYYKYVEKIEPKKKKAALMKGSIIHDMIEGWLNEDDWESPLKKYKKEYDKLFKEEKDEYGDIINDMQTVMTGYVNRWKDEELDYIERNGVRTEHEIEVDLVPGRIILTGIIDRIGIDQRDRVWYVESKSFKQKLPKEDIRYADLQTSIYSWGGPLAGLPEPTGIMWDYIRSKPPTIPELLKKGGLSKAKKIDTTYEVYLQEIRRHGLEVQDYADILEDLRTRPDSYYRRMYRPHPKEMIKPLLRDLKQSALEIEALGETSRVRNLNRECGWCDYNSVCMAELKGLDSEFIKQKDYKERRKEDESKETKEAEDE